jgi:hypothetical protein
VDQSKVYSGVFCFGAKMPILEGYLEQVPWSFYDTLTLTKARTARSLLFQTPFGQSGKTLADTNMYCAGMFPAPSSFICERIRMEVLEGSQEDRNAFGRNWIAELTIGKKPYWSGPTSSLLLEDWLNKALKEIGDGDSTPLPKIWERNLLNGYLAMGHSSTVIGTQEYFHFALSPHKEPFTLSSDFTVRVFLDGQYFRAVQ